MRSSWNTFFFGPARLLLAALRPTPLGRSCFSSAHTHLTSREAGSEMLIYEDLWKMGKEGCRFNAQSARVRSYSQRAPCQEPDTRITNFNKLPNTSFQITGAKVPYDSYTGDMVHRLFHMWQQSDCSVLDATKANPSGCKNDLLPFSALPAATTAAATPWVSITSRMAMRRS